MNNTMFLGGSLALLMASAALARAPDQMLTQVNDVPQISALQTTEEVVYRMDVLSDIAPSLRAADFAATRSDTPTASAIEAPRRAYPMTASRCSWRNEGSATPQRVCRSGPL